MKALIFALTFSLLTIFVTSTSFAAPDDREPKEVKGRIRNSAGKGAEGASVVVQCGTHTINTTAGNNGRYEVTFPSGTCLNGNTITIVASHNGTSGSRTSTATLRRQHNMGEIVLSQAEVPEFGLLTGGVAALGSVAAYLSMRKRFSFTR